jgi:hypothetical protein
MHGLVFGLRITHNLRVSVSVNAFNLKSYSEKDQRHDKAGENALFLLSHLDLSYALKDRNEELLEMEVV